jgi:Tfp pilus assembly protein PilF
MKVRKTISTAAAFATFLCACVTSPLAGAASFRQKSGESQKKEQATQSAPDQPTWDPQRADKDIQVGQFYMHKGDIDAAIDRFEDAIAAKPGYAIPFKYLGEAQEKKGLKKKAVQSYTRYLELDPKADDNDKIRKKIDKLYAEIQKQKKSE